MQLPMHLVCKPFVKRSPENLQQSCAILGGLKNTALPVAQEGTWQTGGIPS